MEQEDMYGFVEAFKAGAANRAEIARSRDAIFGVITAAVGKYARIAGASTLRFSSQEGAAHFHVSLPSRARPWPVCSVEFAAEDGGAPVTVRTPEGSWSGTCADADEFAACLDNVLASDVHAPAVGLDVILAQFEEAVKIGSDGAVHLRREARDDLPAVTLVGGRAGGPDVDLCRIVMSARVYPVVVQRDRHDVGETCHTRVAVVEALRRLLAEKSATFMGRVLGLPALALAPSVTEGPAAPDGDAVLGAGRWGIVRLDGTRVGADVRKLLTDRGDAWTVHDDRGPATIGAPTPRDAALAYARKLDIPFPEILTPAAFADLGTGGVMPGEPVQFKVSRAEARAIFHQLGLSLGYW